MGWRNSYTLSPPYAYYHPWPVNTWPILGFYPIEEDNNPGSVNLQMDENPTRVGRDQSLAN